MSGEDSTEAENTIDTTYATKFRQHLAEVKAHLAGIDEDLLPSYIPPTGYWTPSEKEVFFHSLCVYSRFRPDLIAACIGTKTVLDVCTYIDALAGALSQNQDLLSRADLEGAMEVSDAWIQWEEKRAEALISLETHWEDQIFLHREGGVSSKETSPSSAVGSEGEAFEGEGKEAWENNRIRHWSQEATLRRLDSHHLKVMESILREAESGNVDQGRTLPEDHRCHQGPIPLPSPPNEHSTARTPSNSPVIDDEMIDPVLSGLSVPDLPSQAATIVESHAEGLSHPETTPANKLTTLPPLQPISNARSPSPMGDLGIALDPSDLSPASRRRFKKRLHMRRKRAAERGEEVVNVIGKLRPGRKAQERKPPRPGSRTYGTSSVMQDEAEGEDFLDMKQDTEATQSTLPMSSNVVDGQSSPYGGSPDNLEAREQGEDEEGGNARSRARHTKGGITKPYKIKRDFLSKGINVDTLIEGNLGLFHLSTLSRLMALYKSGYEVTSAIGSSISADTIRLMTAIIIEFTTEVVQRTIISREQEKNMKGSIKVYGRDHNEIVPENVNHVLEMMGMKGFTKEKYFAQLLGEDMCEKPSTEDGDDNISGDGDELDEGAENVEDSNDTGDNDLPRRDASALPLTLLSLHRELHPPLIHLPKSLAPSNGTGSSPDDFSKPIDIDEHELENELQEEMELDKADIALAYAYETDLWKEFGMVMRARKDKGKHKAYNPHI